MRLSQCHDIADLRRLAERRLPRGLFEYVDRGTEDDVAIRLNLRAFETLRLVPRIGRDVSNASTRCLILGLPADMPLAIAPAGPTGLISFEGEMQLAHCALASEVPYIVSSYSMVPLDRIVGTGARIWQQLYFWRDRSLTDRLVERAEQAGVECLMVTLDTPVVGRREYLKRNGFATPATSPKAWCDLACSPIWLSQVALRYVLGPGWPALVHFPSNTKDKVEIAERTTLCSAVSWDDVARLRERWPRKLAVKGVLHADDAEKAISIGCDAIIVSNHGGRNLDSAISPLSVLGEIVNTVNSRAAVFMDSGIRRGADIVKALALGANGVLVGRAPLYGLAGAGAEGAKKALSILQEELTTTLALIGCDDVTRLCRATMRGEILGDGPQPRPTVSNLFHHSI